MMTREEILKEASNIINGDRDQQYGSPEDSFTRIAQLWTDYLHMVPTKILDATDVALMMILFKIARQANGNKLDNWVDICGYAACGGEIEEKKSEES